MDIVCDFVLLFYLEKRTYLYVTLLLPSADIHTRAFRGGGLWPGKVLFFFSITSPKLALNILHKS